MSSKFFTNTENNTLLNKFKGVFENNQDIQTFDALVGYFRASGYFNIRPFLENVPKVRILVGINVDKILAEYNSKGLLFQGDANQTVLEYLEDVKIDIQNASYSKDIEDGILQFVEDIVNQKIEVKAHPHKNLHAKIYIFKPENWNEHKPGNVITGSSNLTQSGLGSGSSSNYEFNVILRDYEDVKFASKEFENLWLEAIPILPVDLEKIKQKTYLNDQFTPFEVYIKFLIEYFGKSVEFDPNSITDLPEGFKRLSYQVDAVNQGYELLKKHNGFFLSDVVGLGKTVVGTLIAKKFFYSNGFPSHISTILIVVPPALKSNWVDTLDKFEVKNYEIVTNGSLHKIINPEKYDLIIVDEAHKFRNDTAEAYNELQKLCKTKTRRILNDESKADKKVILISATPLNNRPSDIANQIYLFQDAKDSTLEIANLQHFFRKKIDDYKHLRDNPNIGEVQEAVKSIYQDIRDKVIAPLTIRRTRTDLKIHSQYNLDIKEQGIIFPDIKKPKKLFYQLTDATEMLYDETMHLLSHDIDGIKYYRYQAIKFLKPDKKSKYKNADVASGALANMMKVLLVKRIDSSFTAFKASLNRFQQATEAMIKMFENNTIYIAPNLNVSEFIIENREDELIKKIQDLAGTDPSVSVCSPDDFEPHFLTELKRDYQIVTVLNNKWSQVSEDPKIDKFIEMIDLEFMNKEINPQGKLVVFSESKETISYIYEKLRAIGRKDVLEVYAGNRDKLKQDIKLNFDANIPRAEYRSDYNIIVCTEVLAEGVNLHRSNVIVNYDTPWNSTKLMQRIGRVNRIGSVAPFIYIYNFYPTAKVNNDIELEKKAIMKLQAFHSALGEDSEIYSPDEQTQTFGLFEKDVEEDKDERLAYLMELRKFKLENPQEFRRIKNLPLKARVGRKDRTKKQSTICFMRNQRRDAFYWVKENNEIEEMGFVEVAKEFRADLPENGIKLHDNHHDQVQIAVADFNEKIQKELAKNQVVDTTQGPNEKRALAYMDGFLNFPFIGEDDKDLIKKAKHAVKTAKFQKLQREINRLKKNAKKNKIKPVDLLDALLNIINKYPLLNDGASNPVVKVKSFQKMKPEIIISESYSYNK
ncbi:helicase-related protein [Flavobacteriales bacterium]|nr:helicase-related protein [Flavobacteriales bacterium]